MNLLVIKQTKLTHTTAKLSKSPLAPIRVHLITETIDAPFGRSKKFIDKVS